MQSYIKYKDDYDRKAKAAPLKEGDYCFVLQLKADHQGSKIPFRDYHWVGPFSIQRVLPNENYIVRRLNTNETQILHHLALKSFVPNQPLQDNFQQERLQQDEEIVIPQDDLYMITWETNFGEQLPTRGSEPIPTSLPNCERPITTEANTSDANENEAYYVITTDSPNADNDAAQSQKERMKNDVSNSNEATEATRNENSAWPDSAVFFTKNKQNLCRICLIDRKTMQIFQEEIQLMKMMHESIQKRGDDIIVPQISQNDARNENLSPRGGRYNLRPNPNPNYSEDFKN